MSSKPEPHLTLLECQTISHAFRVTLLVALALTTSSCSVIGFTYNRADWLAFHYAKGYVDFDSQQGKVLKAALSERLQEHRENELPKYLALLSYGEGLLADGLSTSEGLEMLNRVRGLYEEGVRRTVPKIAPTLLSLSPAQVDELAQNLADKNETFRAKVLSTNLDRRFRRRVRRVSKRIQRWTGPLSDSQLLFVEGRISSMQDLTSDWFDYRQQKQQELLRLLRAQTESDTLEEFLIDWMTTQFDLDQKTVAAAEQWALDVSEMMADLETTLTTEQREELFDTISGYRSIVEELIREGQDREPALFTGDGRD